MLALAGGKVWTAGNWAGVGGFNMTEVSTSTGARTAHEGNTGPASNNDEVKGVGRTPASRCWWSRFDNAIGLYDPATGSSMILSEPAAAPFAARQFAGK